MRADAQMVGQGEMPALAGDQNILNAESVGKPRRFTEDGRAWIEARYEVTLKGNLPTGPQSMSLRLIPKASTSKASQAEREKQALWQRSPILPITTDIKAGLRCLPESLAFGSIGQKSMPKRRILIVALNAEELDGLRVLTAPEWVKTTLSNVPHQNLTLQGFVSTLEVNVLPSVRLGQQNANLTLQTAKGTRLNITLSVQIEK